MKQAYSQTQSLKTFLRHFQEQPPRGLNADGAERVQAIVQRVDERFQPVAADVEKLFNNPRLTDEGKLAEALKIGPSVVGQFQNIANARGQADQAKARLEQFVFGPLTDAPKGNELVQALRDQEIRSSIGKKEAMASFLRAVDTGDLETVRALLLAPGPAWLTDEIIRRGKESFALRTNPEAWERIQYVEVLRDTLRVLAEAIAKWLLALGASPSEVEKATGVSVPQTAQAMALDQYAKQMSAK